MNNFPTVVQMPFLDGVRDVPEHLATLMKEHKMRTYEMTYEMALEQLDFANTRHAVNRAADRIVGDHLRQFGE